MTPSVLSQTADGICTITLNRPEVYNAVNESLANELLTALHRAESDADVRVLVLTGAGNGFCSGADVKEASLFSGNASLGDIVRSRYNPIIRTMRQMPKPIVCRLNGVAAGAGCSLALACDLIIASEKATLSEIFVNIGLVTDAGSSYFLPRLVGSARAFELATLGTPLSARDAQELGVVSRVVPADGLDAAVQEVSHRYAHAPTHAIGAIKQLLNQSFQGSLDDALEREAVAQDSAGRSADHREGVRAFLEKRPAKFTGK